MLLTEVERRIDLRPSILIVGTKTDLTNKAAVDTSDLDYFMEVFDISFAECSANDDVGVNEVFETITGAILKRVIAEKEEKRFK